MGGGIVGCGGVGVEGENDRGVVVGVTELLMGAGGGSVMEGGSC